MGSISWVEFNLLAEQGMSWEPYIAPLVCVHICVITSLYVSMLPVCQAHDSRS